MFWVRLRDGTLERIPGDSYKETKYGHRILKGERWVAEYVREHLVALYRDPPTAIRNDVIAEVCGELEQELEAFVEREFPEEEREKMRAGLLAWLQSTRDKLLEDERVDP